MPDDQAALVVDRAFPADQTDYRLAFDVHPVDQFGGNSNGQSASTKASTGITGTSSASGKPARASVTTATCLLIASNQPGAVPPARHVDGTIDLSIDDGVRPILPAVSDIGRQTTSGSTREFLALCAIAQHLGQPHTATDQS